ncbi:MAG: PAS domain S-box protein [Gammaproteobacteria bacterium]|nr:PAS domain S-box protein [Gammaproteobacteria bacterium]
MISHSPDHHLSKNQRILQHSLWYALICTIILLTIISIHYSIYISTTSNQRNSQQLLNLELGKTSIVTELSNIQSDVNFLARQAELHGYFDQLNDTNLTILANDFQLFSDKKIVYDHIRFIDINGQEIIRINNQNGQSIIVEKDRLQNKINRYYFKESFQLKRNEIYISPFDLNVEHGKIQIPLKPVIRFGTPVFNSKGSKVGVLILNYLGNRLLNNFRTATSNISENVMLLNHDGYWLSHHNRDLEWGFMLGQEQSFATDFEKEWKQVSSNQSGQFETPNGLFSYSTVYPGLEITGLGKEYDQSQTRLEYLNHPWNLIAHISPSELSSLPKIFVRNNMFFYLVIFTLFLIGTHIIARLRVNHQIAEIQVEFEQHFRKVLESIELNVLAVDLQGNISFCNDSLLNLLGWKRNQLIGKNWIETLVVNRYKNTCAKIFQQSKDDNKSTSTHESWLQDKVGREYLIRWHDTSMTDTEGNLIGLIFMGEDITQYRENEIKIRHLSEAVEQSPASVMLTDKHGKIEYINPKFEHLTGYKLDDIKGLNPRVLKSGETSPEDYSRLWNTVRKGKTWRGIFHNRKKNGELYWESASISGIRNPEGEITHFLAVKEDITEQKMLEERFKHCFNSAPVAMVMTDSSGAILLANDTLQQLYGYKEEELVGQAINIIIPDDTESKQLIAQKQNTLDNSAINSTNSMDFLAYKKSGEMFPVEVGFSSAPTLEGKLNISAIIDLTARIELETELLQRNDEISRNQALNTVGKMANMIAHDLRNPLSSIKMGLQIFQKQSNKISHDDAVEINQIALEQVLYMEEILEDLMSYSRPDAVKLEWVEIKKVVEHSIGLVQKDIDSFNAKINTWYEKGLPIINADSRKLRQIISNLLTNAMQSVETLHDVTPVINITVQLDLTESNSYIKITIQDNGCGIDNDKVDELFEPFYTSRAKGTGLGLAIAKRFIELQQGSMQLQAGENEGTTAIVKLNIDPAQ